MRSLNYQKYIAYKKYQMNEKTAYDQKKINTNNKRKILPVKKLLSCQI